MGFELDLRDIQVICSPRSGRSYLFDGGSVLTFQVDLTLATEIERLKLSMSDGLAGETVDRLRVSPRCQRLFEEIAKKRTEQVGALAQREETVRHEEHVSTLFVFTTDHCNLACRYCYEAQKGFQSPTFMNRQIADRVIEGIVLNPRFKKRLTPVEAERVNITFFGGEPLLNVPVMEYICERLASESARHQITVDFGIVTNGTILSERALNLLSKYHFYVTVSIDGPPGIHNQNRPTKGGHGTHTRIAQNLRRLFDERDKGALPHVACEATISQETLTHMSLSEVVMYLADLGVDGVTTSFALCPESHPQYIQPTQRSAEQEIAGYRFLLERSLDGKKPVFHERLLKLLWLLATRRAWVRPCLASLATYSVTARGEVYPCGPLTGWQPFFMGNVLDPGFPGERFFQVKEEVLRANLYADNRCMYCWARHLCVFGHCYASSYVAHRAIQQFSDNQCGERLRFAKAMIALYGDLMSEHKPELLAYMMAPPFMQSLVNE